MLVWEGMGHLRYGFAVGVIGLFGILRRGLAGKEGYLMGH